MFALRWKSQIGGLTSLAYGLMWLVSTIWHDHSHCAPDCCESHSVAAVAEEHCHSHAGHHHSHGGGCAGHRHDTRPRQDAMVLPCEPGLQDEACLICEWWQHLLTSGLPSAPAVHSQTVGALKALADPHWTFVASLLPGCRGPPAA